MLFVGIDVAKNKHDCCIIDYDGVVHSDSLNIENSKIAKARIKVFFGLAG